MIIKETLDRKIIREKPKKSVEKEIGKSKNSKDVQTEPVAIKIGQTLKSISYVCTGKKFKEPELKSV